MPNQFSRYLRTEVYDDEAEPRPRSLRTYRIPYSYREHSGNSIYTVKEGDTLASIAFKRYPSVGANLTGYSPARLYYAIADYQPVPIIDPFIRLREGTNLVMPSLALLVTEIIGG